MKVQFYPDSLESDVIEVPDDISEDELYEMACEWVCDNIPGFWRVIEGAEVEHE